MSKALVSEERWSFVEPELPAPPTVGPRGGRPAVSNRQTFTGIVFILKHGLSWQAIPAELNCGSGSTCWRRFRDWTRQGVWARLHQKALRELGEADELKAQVCTIDSASTRALWGGPTPGRIPPIGRRTAANAT